MPTTVKLSGDNSDRQRKTIRVTESSSDPSSSTHAANHIIFLFSTEKQAIHTPAPEMYSSLLLHTFLDIKKVSFQNTTQ